MWAKLMRVLSDKAWLIVCIMILAFDRRLAGWEDTLLLLVCALGVVAVVMDWRDRIQG